MNSTWNVKLPVPASSDGTNVAVKEITVSTSQIVLGTAQTFDATKVHKVWVQVLTSAIRLRSDATAITNSTGMKLDAGYSDVWSVEFWNAGRVIRDTGAGSDATLVAIPLY